ncbi:MAG: hypothetical protein DMG57_40925 [Acidobacteria bacterium]|nr:MAG: hypothetical protein DMG57_40925 [Acidobacteriota bacterium]
MAGIELRSRAQEQIITLLPERRLLSATRGADPDFTNRLKITTETTEKRLKIRLTPPANPYRIPSLGGSHDEPDTLFLLASLSAFDLFK